MNADFRYRLRVRYGECDAQKVVFNARYGDYVDLATNEFFRALGFGEQLVSGELDFQLVKQVTQWQAPARFDQVLELSVRCLRIGTTSFELATQFHIVGAAAVIAEVQTVYVLVDTATLAAKPVVGALRAGLQQGIAAMVDHAASAA